MAATGLVLLVHGALLMLLLYGHRARPEQEPSIAFVSIWPEPRPVEPEPVPPEAAPPTPAPATAPRNPAALAQPAGEAAESPATPPDTKSESPSAPIDWSRAATAAAGRQGSRAEGPGSFSPAPATTRKPCKPPKSSFEWNPEEKRAGLAPLPYVRLGKRCIVMLGFFGCTLSPLPEANGKLFDDLKEGKAQESSVPDPDHCD